MPLAACQAEEDTANNLGAHRVCQDNEHFSHRGHGLVTRQSATVSCCSDLQACAVGRAAHELCACAVGAAIVHHCVSAPSRQAVRQLLVIELNSAVLSAAAPRNCC